MWMGRRVLQPAPMAAPFPSPLVVIVETSSLRSVYSCVARGSGGSGVGCVSACEAFATEPAVFLEFEATAETTVGAGTEVKPSLHVALCIDGRPSSASTQSKEVCEEVKKWMREEASLLVAVIRQLRFDHRVHSDKW